MKPELLSGLLIPFLGTSLGAGCVLFMNHELSQTLQRALTGFAAGVMAAASIWSLSIKSGAVSSLRHRFYLYCPILLPFYPVRSVIPFRPIANVEALCSMADVAGGRIPAAPPNHKYQHRSFISYCALSFASAFDPAVFNMQDMGAAAVDQFHIMGHDQHSDTFIQ